MIYLILLILFFFGLSIGSFLNVVIDRLPNGQSIIKKRSHCDFCKKELRWVDLIPLLSFIVLKGKCRYCKKKLKLQYPLVELMTAFLFIAVYFLTIGDSFKNYNLWILFALNIAFVSSLLSIALIDLRSGMIPDKILIFLLSAFFVYKLIFMTNLIVPNLITATISFAFFLTLYLVTKEKGLGFGDVKFAFLIGFLLGFPNVITGLYLAFLTGAITSIILVLWRKKKFSNAVPFGPFLASSLFVTYFWGEKITQWAIKILGF